MYTILKLSKIIFSSVLRLTSKYGILLIDYKFKFSVSELEVTARLPQQAGGEAEIWFHEDCFCWVPGVYLVGSRWEQAM